MGTVDSADARPVSALTIAGSDSGGGAGIQADLKTFAAHGVHGLSAIAALTAQNTRGVTAVHVPPVSFLRAQLDALFADFRIGAVKLGMLANAEVIHAVADALQYYREEGHAAPVVLDPVMVATSGARLLDPDALQALRTRLLPMATLITPNIPEAEWLLERRIDSAPAADAALEALRARGAKAVLLKGGHLPVPGPMVDRYGDGERLEQFVHERLELEGHGTGCTLASAIAANLCRGLPLLAACEAATAYVHGALLHASRPGLGHASVLGHFWERRG
ncbi:MAG TPA: bifunctional hydroxymethylpyrimidine kinase/phosphomethylpyrimidine kinase [Aggregicoccus sp.]|nr:bifunctional hydroxymethylpyrimidine kinase/phosphomethylpyrimidine kinase [Aggregicoccus sp.]